ncbi:hypothetical protein F2Q69_00058318 [Brassica cretica]|uniref:Uncharacterized protein n=1 Tax=Brassica cretica TaxID=69181 RepID=A0A8S9RGP1_BRACR|nr:hypothetical protein F2Q69_00058318 [Brassica cretica]
MLLYFWVMEDDDPFSFFEVLLEMEEEEDGTEHLVDELRTNARAFVEEALVEKLLENLDLEELEDEQEADDASFFDSFHFSLISVLQEERNM